MWLGEKAHSQAVLPAFLLGLALSRTFARHRAAQQRFRVVAFALLTPFFFLRSGMNVSLPLVIANLGLLGVKLALKVPHRPPLALPLPRTSSSSGIELDALDPYRLGVTIGSAVGATMGLYEEYRTVSDGGRLTLVDHTYAVPHLYDFRWTGRPAGPSGRSGTVVDGEGEAARSEEAGGGVVALASTGGDVGGVVGGGQVQALGQESAAGALSAADGVDSEVFQGCGAVDGRVQEAVASRVPSVPVIFRRQPGGLVRAVTSASG
jgi:hypothetical protein